MTGFACLAIFCAVLWGSIFISNSIDSLTQAVRENTRLRK